MAEIIAIDEYLFNLFNNQWSNGFFDVIMPIWRNKVFWIPFYVFLLALVGFNFPKKLVPFFLMALLTIGISDTISSRLIKKTVKRDRPCRQANLVEDARVLVKCGGGFSFTSSHATNHFALATFFILSIGFLFPYTKYIFLLWAASISYGQVYVGVHFPFDVIMGGFIGAFIGYLLGRTFNKYWGLSNKEPINQLA